MTEVVQESGTIERVSNGIWRVRLGQPEKLTPLSYRTALPGEGLKTLPECSELPFRLEEIGFKQTARGCAITLPMSTDERIYGLGLNTKLFDKTDRRVFLRPSDDCENDQGDSHAPVPFYVSTAGYGVYVDTARYASFYTGNVSPCGSKETTGAAGGAANSTEELYKNRVLSSKSMLIDVPSAQGADLYIFGGPALGDAVRRYNLFCGGGAAPPLWGLGIAYRGKGDFTAAKSIQLAQSLRDTHIPCDIWGVEPGWQTRTYSCSFVWNSEKFPDPEGFIDNMHGLGYHTSFWEHAFTHPSSPIYDALQPFSGDYRVWDGLVPDFATEDGRRIFLDHQEKVLYSLGVDSVKLDECDNQPNSATPWSFPEASLFPSGLDGELYHSLFGKLYQDAMAEPLLKANKRTWGLVRNAHALSAPQPYVIYSDTYDHACYVRGLANSGFCGQLWTPEVRDADTAEELCRRVATVIFSAYAMVNSWYIEMPPWVQVDKDKNNAGIPMEDQEEATNAVRSLFELRMSLVPYLYSAFMDYAKTGTPPIRALVSDWPEQSAVHDVDDQFLFGPSLMIAPLLSGQTQRSVYLPPGTWHNFWTGETLTGGRSISDVTSPLDQVPMYVRDNSILPLAQSVEHITPDTKFALTVRVYGARPEPFTLYADDGISNDYLRGVQSEVTLTWKNGSGNVATVGSYTEVDRYEVKAWELRN